MITASWSSMSHIRASWNLLWNQGQIWFRCGDQANNPQGIRHSPPEKHADYSLNRPATRELAPAKSILHTLFPCFSFKRQFGSAIHTAPFQLPTFSSPLAHQKEHVSATLFLYNFPMTWKRALWMRHARTQHQKHLKIKVLAFTKFEWWKQKITISVASKLGGERETSTLIKLFASTLTKAKKKKKNCKREKERKNSFMPNQLDQPSAILEKNDSRWS